MPGFATSAPEVTPVARHGLWLLLNDEELLVRFSDFPWFRQATIEALTACGPINRFTTRALNAALYTGIRSLTFTPNVSYTTDVLTPVVRQLS
jgi:hypothetical protein